MTGEKILRRQNLKGFKTKSNDKHLKAKTLCYHTTTEAFM
jgi:hypothetical protein